MNSLNMTTTIGTTPAIADFLRPPVIGLQPQTNSGENFSDVLTQAMLPSDVDVRLSAHAKQRLEMRGITLDTQDMKKLDEAMDKAEEKGAHNSLIVYNGNAFVVNIDNRTVVTALDSSNVAQNVFTQIDSAVVV